MSRRCELTGKLPLSGNLRSHAENKTRRKFRPNLVKVTLMSDILKRSVRFKITDLFRISLIKVTLMSDILKRSVRFKITAHALKSVEHRGGLDAFLAKARDEELSANALRLKRDIAKAKAEAKAESAA